jgi:hypothetical protein
MANYSITNSTQFGTQQPTSASYVSLISVAASTAGGGTNTGLRRGKLYDLLVGTNGAPADNAIEWAIHRVTNTTQAYAGNISSVSSYFALDPADGGFAANATAVASGNSSTAYAFFGTANVAWYVGVNQRASYRWVAAPGSEIVYPAVSSASGGNGLVLSVRSAAYTGTTTGTVLFQEQ